MSEDDVRAMLSRQFRPFVNRGSSGMTAWAAAHGVSHSKLSEFMAGKRSPTTDILDALGLEWRIVRKRMSP